MKTKDILYTRRAAAPQPFETSRHCNMPKLFEKHHQKHDSNCSPLSEYTNVKNQSVLPQNCIIIPKFQNKTTETRTINQYQRPTESHDSGRLRATTRDGRGQASAGNPPPRAEPPGATGDVSMRTRATVDGPVRRRGRSAREVASASATLAPPNVPEVRRRA